MQLYLNESFPIAYFSFLLNTKNNKINQTKKKIIHAVYYIKNISKEKVTTDKICLYLKKKDLSVINFIDDDILKVIENMVKEKKEVENDTTKSCIMLYQLQKHKTTLK